MGKIKVKQSIRRRKDRTDVGKVEFK